MRTKFRLPEPLRRFKVGRYPCTVIDTPQALEERCINTIRGLSIDAVQAANSGHPGLPMGAAPMAFALWTRHLSHNPSNPKWFDRDRFVLSAGHGSMLLYSLLHLTGYDLPLEELKRFRQLHSKTPGHPENTHTPGVEMATGPLGQGIATATGMAIAEKFLAATYNRPGYTVVDHHTYGICSDGDLMEGVSGEAASLAGHLQLGKLIFLYDDNGITIDGNTAISFTEDVSARYSAYGWHVQTIDGMDVEAVDHAIVAAKADPRPSLILCKTIIGFGSPNRAGTNKAHSNPLGPEELALTKANLEIPAEPTFFIAEDVCDFYRTARISGAEAQSAWQNTLEGYAKAFPELAAEFNRTIAGELTPGWECAIPSPQGSMATRKACQQVLEALQSYLPAVIGGAADLVESTFTHQSSSSDFSPETPAGKNINFGVREHAMAAAVNGITLHGGTRAYGSSFFVFTDYARPSIRLAALMECPSIFVFTHDSIGVGEDGPTHQPIEHLASLRAMPNLNLIRPCDGPETAVAWKLALTSKDHPTLLALTRQAVPTLSPVEISNHPAEKGGYVLQDCEGRPDAILVGTGSEVQLCTAAKALLEQKGIAVRVVSLPSWFLFERQAAEYRASILPRAIPTLSVEAGSSLGWAKYATEHIALDRFGLSAPYGQVMAEFGFTPENVAAKVRSMLGK